MLTPTILRAGRNKATRATTRSRSNEQQATQDSKRKTKKNAPVVTTVTQSSDEDEPSPTPAKKQKTMPSGKKPKVEKPSASSNTNSAPAVFNVDYDDSETQAVIQHWNEIHNFHRLDGLQPRHFAPHTAAHRMQHLAIDAITNPDDEATQITEWLEVISQGVNTWQIETMEGMMGPNPTPQAFLVRTDQRNRFQIIYGFGKVVGSRFGTHSALQGRWLFFEGDKGTSEVLPNMLELPKNQNNLFKHARTLMVNEVCNDSLAAKNGVRSTTKSHPQTEFPMLLPLPWSWAATLIAHPDWPVQTSIHYIISKMEHWSPDTAECQETVMKFLCAAATASASNKPQPRGSLPTKATKLDEGAQQWAVAHWNRLFPVPAAGQPKEATEPQQPRPEPPRDDESQEPPVHPRDGHDGQDGNRSHNSGPSSQTPPSPGTNPSMTEFVNASTRLLQAIELQTTTLRNQGQHHPGPADEGTNDDDSPTKDNSAKAWTDVKQAKLCAWAGVRYGSSRLPPFFQSLTTARADDKTSIIQNLFGRLKREYAEFIDFEPSLELIDDLKKQALASPMMSTSKWYRGIGPMAFADRDIAETDAARETEALLAQRGNLISLSLADAKAFETGPPPIPKSMEKGLKYIRRWSIFLKITLGPACSLHKEAKSLHGDLLSLLPRIQRAPSFTEERLPAIMWELSHASRDFFNRIVSKEAFDMADEEEDDAPRVKAFLPLDSLLSMSAPAPRDMPAYLRPTEIPSEGNSQQSSTPLKRQTGGRTNRNDTDTPTRSSPIKANPEWMAQFRDMCSTTDTRVLHRLTLGKIMTGANKTMDWLRNTMNAEDTCCVRWHILGSCRRDRCRRQHSKPAGLTNEAATSIAQALQPAVRTEVASLTRS